MLSNVYSSKKQQLPLKTSIILDCAWAMDDERTGAQTAAAAE